MKSYEEFIEWVLDRESRTVHKVSGDAGGLTCAGIARKYHPKWEGWKLVDKGVRDWKSLKPYVISFYKKEYNDFWNMFPYPLNMYAVDTAINMSHKNAAQYIQRAINYILDDNELVVDGKFGSKSYAALAKCDIHAVFFAACCVRLIEYGKRGKQGDVRRKFLDGWINRVHSLISLV